jgi:hypothetical protein
MNAGSPFEMATPPEWRCPTVRWHRPAMHYRENHHVWPKEYGGPANGPLVGICGGCHNEIHGLLVKAKANAWTLTPGMYRGCSTRVVDLAILGLDAINTKTLPVLPAWAAGTAAP